LFNLFLLGSLAQLGSPDPLRLTRALAIYPPSQILALLHDNNSVSVMKLTNGIPDLSSRYIITNSPITTAGRDLAFDAAGNIYTVGSGQGLLRVQSAGGTTIATTGSDGTFNVISPLAGITVSAVDNYATETTGDTGEFVITRSSADLSVPLTVFYALGGSATNTADYATLSGSVVIPAGTNAVSVAIAPVDDTLPEFTETVVLILVTNASYAIDLPGFATVSIVDNETPELSISTVSPSMYERIAGDYATFRLTRRGDTNLSVTANISYAGTANGSRYSGPATANVDTGPSTRLR